MTPSILLSLDRNLMNNKKIYVIALLLLACSVSLLAQGPGVIKRTITKTERFDFGAGGTISITGAPIGSIIVTDSAKNEVEITASIELQAATEADMAKLAETTGFVTDDSAIRTTIITVGVHNKFGLKKLPKSFPKNLLALPFMVNYVIRVPRYSDLEIDGGVGKLSISGVEGSKRINFLESNADIELVGGSTTDVTIGTGSLDVAFGIGWRGRSANILLANGKMNIRLPSNLSADIDAFVLKTGLIENILPDLKPRDRKAPFTDRAVTATAGVGGASLKFTVGDGTIKFERITKPL